MHKYIKSSFVGFFGIVMISTYIYGKISFQRKYRNFEYDHD